MLIFHFIFNFLWRGRGSSVTSVAFLGFREKHGTKRLSDNEMTIGLLHRFALNTIMDHYKAKNEWLDFI